jgi:hypothetical protein
LIATAPELLDALESIEAELSRLGFGHDGDINGGDCVEAMAALLPMIVRATGKARGA